MSIFGAVSLLANAVALALAISLAVRARNREMVILSGVLAAMFALRVTYPNHLLLLSLPLTGIALVVLWRQGRPSAGDGLWTIRVGCSLLVVSFAIHALELEPLPGLPAGVLASRRRTRRRRHHRPQACRSHRRRRSPYRQLDTPRSHLRRLRPPLLCQRKICLDDRQDRTHQDLHHPLTIGSDPFYGQYITGLIDEIRVYDTVLDTSQIQSDMTTPVAATPVTHSS